MQTIKLLNQDTVLLSQPQLIKEFGRSAAHLLCQMNYWLNKEQGIVKDGVRWIYNSADQWAEQLAISPRQVRRIINKLIDRGVIRIAKLSPIKQVRVNYFTLDHDCLNEIISSSEAGKNASESARQNTPNSVQKTGNNGHISSVTVENVHADIMSASLGHNDLMYIQRLTNKDKNNKSRAFEAVEPETNTGKKETETTEFPSQVGQVKKNNFNSVEVSKTPMKKPEQIVEIIQEVGLEMGEGEEKSYSRDISKEDFKKNSSEVSPEISKLPNTTVQDMVAIWNEAFPNAAEKLSKSLAPMLVSAFKTRFESNMERFKHYCALIQSSPYLMGEGFSLKLEWAMKFKTIDRLLNGELGVKQVEFKPAESSQQDKANEHVDAVNEPDDCKDTRRMLLKILGADSYLSWFTQVDFVHRNGQIQMRPHNRFVQDQVERRFGQMLGMTIAV